MLLFIPLITEIRVRDEKSGYPRVQIYEKSGYPSVQIYEQGDNKSYKRVQRYVRISSSILLYRHYTEGKRL
jgi:hypothetical protein